MPEFCLNDWMLRVIANDRRRVLTIHRDYFQFNIWPKVDSTKLARKH